jgi:hypothetical protein
MIKNTLKIAFMNRMGRDSATLFFVSYCVDTETNTCINKRVFYEIDGCVMSREFKGAEILPIAEILLYQDGNPIPDIKKFIIERGFKEGFCWGEYFIDRSIFPPNTVFMDIMNWFNGNGIKRTWGRSVDDVEFIKNSTGAGK